MLLPTVSVTLIGLIAGLVFVVGSRSQPTRTLLLAVFSAWVGFTVGAIIGVLIDVFALTGVYVALVGHLLAIAGAVVVPYRFRTY